jgi:hypothetical protein
VKYIYLDFDGVLNPWPYTPGANLDYDFDRHLRYGPYAVRVSTAMIDDLVKVAAESGAQIVWCSTWCLVPEDTAWLRANVLDVPALPLRKRMSSYGNHFKWDGQEAHYLEHSDGDRFVWIDDEALPYEEDRGVSGLYIAPEGDVGLTKEHMKQIKEWLK